MRFNHTKLFHGLLLLASLLLAACGGGGGGSTTPAPTGPFTIGGSVTSLTGSGLVLRNNGGDDKSITAAAGSYTFATSIANGGSYNVTVLTNPTSQVCTVANASGSASANVANANVNCVTAYTIGGNIISSVAGIGPILQNNLGDNLFTPAIINGFTPFTFSTPVASGGSYSVTQLSRARAPTQNCVVTSGNGPVTTTISSVVVTCTVTTAVPKFAYATNRTANTVSAYTINPPDGVLTSVGAAVAAGTGPYSVSVEPAGRFAYVANIDSNTVSAYSIDYAATGALTAIDANGAVAGTQAGIATGAFPISITIHPSGKFAYVANQVDTTAGSISAYSINTTTGALSAMDADGATTGTQTTIATGGWPYAVTIDPTGQFAYVANDASNTVSVYTINQTTGALTAGTAVNAGTNPRSVAIDPTGNFAFVANAGGNVSTYSIGGGGVLALVGTYGAGTAPRSVAVDPSGAYVYVANAGSNNVSAYTNTSGALALVGTYGAGASPVSVNVDPSGLFVYVANFGDNTVSVYSIGSGGALTPGTPATTTTGTGPTSVTTTQ